jgi:hypothetical protein
MENTNYQLNPLAAEYNHWNPTPTLPPKTNRRKLPTKSLLGNRQNRKMTQSLTGKKQNGKMTSYQHLTNRRETDQSLRRKATAEKARQEYSPKM